MRPHCVVEEAKFDRAQFIKYSETVLLQPDLTANDSLLLSVAVAQVS